MTMTVPVPRIQVTIRPSTLDRSERRLATFEVRIAVRGGGEIRIDGCQIFRTREGHTSAALTSFTERVDGKILHLPVVMLPAQLEQAILRTALEEYQTWLRARTPAPTERGKLYPTPEPTSAECAVEHATSNPVCAT
jgi:hypothetical protein